MELSPRRIFSGGTSPFAYLRGGVVFTPSGPGSYAPIAGTDDLELMVGGTRHQLAVQGVIGCYQFNALRERDQRLMRGWVMMRHVSMEYTGWRVSDGAVQLCFRSDFVLEHAGQRLSELQRLDGLLLLAIGLVAQSQMVADDTDVRRPGIHR